MSAQGGDQQDDAHSGGDPNVDVRKLQGFQTHHWPSTIRLMGLDAMVCFMQIMRDPNRQFTSDCNFDEGTVTLTRKPSR